MLPDEAVDESIHFLLVNYSSVRVTAQVFGAFPTLCVYVTPLWTHLHDNSVGFVMHNNQGKNNYGIF